MVLASDLRVRQCKPGPVSITTNGHRHIPGIANGKHWSYLLFKDCLQFSTRNRICQGFDGEIAKPLRIKKSEAVFVDIFANAKSIYPCVTDSICLLMQTRYDIAPTCAPAHIERKHIECRQAYIEAPARELYRVFTPCRRSSRYKACSGRCRWPPERPPETGSRWSRSPSSP